MGLNSLPTIADYWASNPCLGNREVKVMTRNQFESISWFLHFNNSSAAPKRAEPNFDCLYKIQPVLEYANKKLLKCTKRKLKKSGEIENNLVYTKWHNKQDVNLLSTNINPTEPTIIKQRRRQNGEMAKVEKPKVVVKYNNHMGGVDHADQLRSYYGIGRSSHKWYMYKYLFWFVFEVLLSNCFILHKENLQREWHYTIHNFRLALTKQ